MLGFSFPSSLTPAYLEVDTDSPHLQSAEPPIDSSFPTWPSPKNSNELGRRYYVGIDDEEDAFAATQIGISYDPYFHDAPSRPRSASDELDEIRCCCLSRPFGKVPYAHRARHVLLSLRLGKAYICYCLICFALSMIVCFSTVFHVMKRKYEGGDLRHHNWHTWETVLEVLIGVAVCIETITTFWLVGRKAFVSDFWCLFDAVVVVLTLFDWCLLFLRDALLAYTLAEIDFPLFALRFILQPCRILASISMIRRVRKLQQSTLDISLDMVSKASEISVQASEESRILNPELRLEVVTHLPTWCRFQRWDLLYSPQKHGYSLNTFFRCQKGANIILVRDARNRIFGAFNPEPWTLCPHGRHGSRECFVFSSTPIEDGGLTNRINFYHAVEQEESVLLWGDSNMFSFGDALVFRDDFRFGSTAHCAAFGSPALIEDGSDFDVVDFECWSLQCQEQSLNFRLS